MSSLRSKVCAVAGGAGAVGEGIVRALLSAGATVLAVDREPEALDSLWADLSHDDCDRLLIHVCDVSEAEELGALAESVVAGFGGLDAAVACLGGPWERRSLTETSMRDWRGAVEQRVNAHFLLARTLVPLLGKREDGGYVFVNGGGALHVRPGEGALAVGSAAQLMLKEAVLAEHGEHLPVFALLLDTPVRSRKLKRDEQSWPSANDVGRAVTTLLGPEGARWRGRSLHITQRHDLTELLG